MPVIESEENITIKSKTEIARRAVCCLVTIQHAYDLMNQDDEDGSYQFFYGLLERWGLSECLTADEQAVFSRALSREQLGIFTWKYEAYWVLAWALGFVKKLGLPTDTCDVSKAIAFVSDHESFDSFLKAAKTRKAYEILDETDLIFRIHWACREAGLHGKDSPANMNSSVVLERHMALNWLIRFNVDGEWEDWGDWDNVSTNT